MEPPSVTRKPLSFSQTTQPAFLEEIRSGDEHAWFEFYRRYVNMIRHVGSTRGLSPAECDDLMVEVMIIFWKKVDCFIYNSEQGRFRSYLWRIADLLSLNFIKKRENYHTAVDDQLLQYPDYVDTDYMEEWRSFLLGQALEELRESVDDISYQVFYMSFCEKYSVQKISAVTRKSPNAVYIIRSRCLKKLKKIIASYRQLEEESFSALNSQSIKLPV